MFKTLIAFLFALPLLTACDMANLTGTKPQAASCSIIHKADSVRVVMANGDTVWAPVTVTISRHCVTTDDDSHTLALDASVRAFLPRGPFVVCRASAADTLLHIAQLGPVTGIGSTGLTGEVGSKPHTPNPACFTLPALRFES